MKRLYLFLFLLLLGGIGVTIVAFYRYYAPPSIRQPYQTAQHHDDTLRIAYIGDSWAFMHKEHECIIAKYLEDTIHRPVKVHSYGVCGLTSKEIYENMFCNSDFKQFLQKRGYDYCFISAGINDSYKKMSTSYYAKSMDCIIQFLLGNDIRPIILEIPDYDIQKSYDRQKTSRKVLRRLSIFINNTPIDCKQQFRDAFHELIREKEYQDKVSIIRYNSWNNDYLNDLKQLYLDDGLHLNEQGYARLDSVIAKEIIKSYRPTTTPNISVNSSTTRR